MGKQWKQCQTLFWGAPKSLQMVIAAMKLKDAYSLDKHTVKKAAVQRSLDSLISLGAQTHTVALPSTLSAITG